MRVLAIDPGTTQSAYCVIDAETLKPQEFAKVDNYDIRNIIRDMDFTRTDYGAIEMLQSYGTLIGRDVLETAVWVGRFFECLSRKSYYELRLELVYRMDVKMHICQDSRAKDSNIRRALIDRFAKHDFKNGKGTKKQPDWFYGFHSDIWSAYAIAVCVAETMIEKG